MAKNIECTKVAGGVDDDGKHIQISNMVLSDAPAVSQVEEGNHERFETSARHL